MSDELQAGKDMDAAVHVQVWGEITCSHGIDCSDILPYSTDLESAWLIVEVLREIGFGVALYTEADGWEIELISTEALSASGYRGCYVQAETVPLAVCRAALKACGEALAATSAGKGEG